MFKRILTICILGILLCPSAFAEHVYKYKLYHPSNYQIMTGHLERSHYGYKFTITYKDTNTKKIYTRSLGHRMEFNHEVEYVPINTTNIWIQEVRK